MIVICFDVRKINWFYFVFFSLICIFAPTIDSIMDVEAIKKIIEKEPNLSTALGMEFYSTPEDDTCMAVMQVDQRNRQPFGFLSGGASLALAENVAGVGSTALCPGKICVGISVKAVSVIKDMKKSKKTEKKTAESGIL